MILHTIRRRGAVQADLMIDDAGQYLGSIADSFECSFGQLVENIMSDHLQMHVALNANGVHAVAITAIVPRYDGETNCQLLGCSGDQAIEWRHLIVDLEEWARRLGCRMMQPVARRGWSKSLGKYGYRTTHYVLEKVL